MRSFLLAVFIFVVVASTAVAQLYQWTDENGVKHWGDAPPPSAEDVATMREDKITPEDRAQEAANRARSDRQERDSQIEALLSKKAEPASKRPEVERPEYEFDWRDPVLRGNTLEVSGRVSYGPDCKRLKVSVYLTDENDSSAHVACFADDVGGSASRTLNGKDRVYGNGKRWGITDTYVFCMD